MRKLKVIEGSGNVFADIGLENADELLAKAELASLINQAIRNRSYTQSVAADVLGIDQPRVSALRRGRLQLFSLSKLAQFISRLGSAVEITVRPATSRSSHFSVKSVNNSAGVILWHPELFAAATTAVRSARVANQAPFLMEVFPKTQAVNTASAPFVLESLNVQIPHLGAMMYARTKELHV